MLNPRVGTLVSWLVERFSRVHTTVYTVHSVCTLPPRLRSAGSTDLSAGRCANARVRQARQAAQATAPRPEKTGDHGRFSVAMARPTIAALIFVFDVLSSFQKSLGHLTGLLQGVLGSCDRTSTSPVAAKHLLNLMTNRTPLDYATSAYLGPLWCDDRARTNRFSLGVLL